MGIEDILLAVCMFFGAVLYTSVGHAGASAYIALMALFGVAAPVMRPTALVLNVLIAGFTSFRFVRAGLFRWRTLWPVLIGAIPMAFLGGYVQLPGHFYRPLVGVVLLCAAVRFLWPRDLKPVQEPVDIPVNWGILSGIGVGFLSGLTGTGGGIFLSPILLFMGWSEARTASGVVAVFILCNSISGLLGNVSAVRDLPGELPLFAAAVMLGAIVGTYIGVNRLAARGVFKALGLVLLIAGFKLIGVY